MAHHACNVANYFIESRPGKIDTMKILKLVYLAHGWNLAINDLPLIRQEVEAWKFGPIIPALYSTMFGMGNILHELALPAPAEEPFRVEQEDVMDEVLDAYGNLSNIKLAYMTHGDSTPWHQFYHPNDHAIIPNSSIKDFFRTVAIGSKRP